MFSLRGPSGPRHVVVSTKQRPNRVGKQGVCAACLRELVERGSRATHGRLAVLGGARGSARRVTS